MPCSEGTWRDTCPRRWRWNSNLSLTDGQFPFVLLLQHQVAHVLHIQTWANSWTGSMLSEVNVCVYWIYVSMIVPRQLSQTCMRLESAWPTRWTGGAESVRWPLLGWCTLTPGAVEWTTLWPHRPGSAWKICQHRKDWWPLAMRGRSGSGGASWFFN